MLDRSYADIARRTASREKTTALIVEEELLWDGTVLKIQANYLQPFVGALQSIGVESVSFHRGISRSEITEFLKTLASNRADSLPSSARIKIGKLQLNCKETDLAPLSGTEQQRVSAFVSRRGEHYPEVKDLCHRISHRQVFSIKGVEAIVMALIQGFVHNINPIRLLMQMKLEDEYTYTHMVNVCILTMCQAESLGFPAECLSKVGVAAILHDAGKLLIPADILNKPGKLTSEERSIIETHPLRGASFILKNDSVPRFAVLGALEHHIKYDGTGYPFISTAYRPNIISQMIAIADVFDAMRTRRSYKEPKPVKDIVSVLMKEKGTAYHPRLIDNFLKLIQEDDRSNPAASTRASMEQGAIA